MGAMGAAQNLQGKIQSAKEVKGVRDAVQQSMAGLKSTASVVESMPPGIAPSKALQKRFTTLQNAVVHASNSAPQDVQSTHRLFRVFGIQHSSQVCSQSLSRCPPLPRALLP